MINSYNNYSNNYSYDILIIVSDGNRTEWSTIQGVISQGHRMRPV